MCVSSRALSGVVAALALAAPLRAQELALKSSSPPSNLFDLQRREISMLLNGRMRGSWPVAIGGIKTPTPQGEFAILTKNSTPFTFQKNLDLARSSAAQRAQSVIAIWSSIATVAENSVSMACPGPIG